MVYAAGPRIPRPTPPFLKRRVWQFVAVTASLSIGGILVQLAVRRYVPVWAFITASVVPGVACAVFSALFAVWMSRHYRRALDADGRICWHCGYALAGLADQGACPECGNPYTLAQLRERWLTPGRNASDAGRSRATSGAGAAAAVEEPPAGPA